MVLESSSCGEAVVLNQDIQVSGSCIFSQKVEGVGNDQGNEDTSSLPDATYHEDGLDGESDELVIS